MLKCYLLIFISLLVFATVPAFSQDAAKQVIKAVEIRYSSGLFGERCYRVYHSGPFFVYQGQYLLNSFILSPKYDSVAHEEVLESTLKQRAWKDYYFVFHEDSSYGIRFYPDDIDYNQCFRVDSFLQIIRQTTNYENVLLGKPDTATWSDNRAFLKEVYIGKPQKDTLTGSMVLYYSSRINNITESLNEKLDKAKRLKLYKIEIVASEFYSEKDKQLWPAMKITTTLKEISIENPAEVANYINKYRRICAQVESP